MNIGGSDLDLLYFRHLMEDIVRDEVTSSLLGRNSDLPLVPHTAFPRLRHFGLDVHLNVWKTMTLILIWLIQECEKITLLIFFFLQKHGNTCRLLADKFIYRHTRTCNFEEKKIRKMVKSISD